MPPSAPAWRWRTPGTRPRSSSVTAWQDPTGNAEYDRLIATCSVRYIPLAWMEQVRDGGTITAPLSGWMPGDAMAHLTLADDGTACGRFLPDDFAFMPARPHARPPRSSYMIGLGTERESRIDPNVLDDHAALIRCPARRSIGREAGVR